MARPLRIEFPGAVYHVTSRGNARQNIFFDDVDRQVFLKVLGNVVEKYNWLCHAFCLLDNHYHILVETQDPNLSLGMRQLNGVYTQGSISGIIGSAISSRDATRQSWWKKMSIYWNSAAILFLIRCERGW